MTTYYAIATVVATGVEMQDTGLTAAQIDHLRAAEARGTITDLQVGVDVDIVAAFRNPF